MTSFCRLMALFLIGLPVLPQTNISVSAAAIQTGVKRLGINLGGNRFYDSGQILKNLTMRNPGFEPSLYRSTVQCGSNATASGCTDNLPYGGWKTGFWAAGSTVSVISGAAAGCATTIANFTGPSGTVGGVYAFASACSAPLAPGDYFIVGQTIPGNPTFGWWPTSTGGGAFSADTTDLPSPASGVQALKVNAPNVGDLCTLTSFFDSNTARSFVTLNGSYQIQFQAKGLSGSQQVQVQFFRGGTAYTSQTVSLTGAWATYTVNFNASETGTQTGNAQLTFTTVGADSFYIDNVSTVQTGSGNPTAFRDPVVNTLQTLKPGIIRMWDGSGLGNSLDNMLADQFGRQPSNFLVWHSGPHEDVSYGLFDFLQLVQTVGYSAEPWVVVPITFTPAEASNLIDYLSGGANTVYGAKRIAQGQAAPWTNVFPKIHLEFGNEAWNSGFEGGIIQKPLVYAARAQTIFRAMRANPNYLSRSFDLVLGAQAANANTVQTIQNACNNNDSISVAPYMMNTITDTTSTANLFQPTLAEPQALYSNAPGVTAEGIGKGYFILGSTAQQVNGGEMYLDILAAANSTNPKPVSIYEENLSTTGGTISQSALNSYVSSMGAGLASVSEQLLGMQNGILNQNLFALTQWQFKRPDGAMAYLWGSVIDMGGPTNLRRPQYLAQQLANSAITPGGVMLKTVQSGTNPKWNQPLVNTVAMNGASVIQSFAFNNGSNGYSLILLNNSLTGAETVTFSGTNAPAGTVYQQQLTSANITDTNETSAVIAPTYTTLQGFKPATGITLPPFSMTVLTYSVGSPTALTRRMSNPGGPLSRRLGVSR
jgi:hypothetical protein